MGLMSVSSIAPPPCMDVADNGLAAWMHVDVLDCHLLRAARPVSLQGFELGREGAA